MKVDVMNSVRLAAFDNDWYRPGRSHLTQALWFFFGLPILRSSVLPLSSAKRGLLRLFGARIGRGTVIKPGVRVKYPWLFATGEHCWIGEDCWIDNMAPVTLGSNVCISQGAYLCTGNHDWSDPAFGLTVNSIEIRDGAWVGAKAFLAPGVDVSECAVVVAGSVITQDIPPFEIYGGNPAVFIRKREIKDQNNESSSTDDDSPRRETKKSKRVSPGRNRRNKRTLLEITDKQT
jgi:putative colanic acid biosynthesis acetyltransferase WcaF